MLMVCAIGSAVFHSPFSLVVGIMFSWNFALASSDILEMSPEAWAAR
jgi:hypothetical protein